MKKNICPFKVPDEKLRLNAVGSLAGTPIKMKKALQVILPLFYPIPEPGPQIGFGSMMKMVKPMTPIKLYQ